MGLELYIAHRDKFEADEPDGGFQLAFPCCVCKHRHGADMDEPCRSCDHNANAVESSQADILCGLLAEAREK